MVLGRDLSPVYQDLQRKFQKYLPKYSDVRLFVQVEQRPPKGGEALLGPRIIDLTRKQET